MTRPVAGDIRYSGYPTSHVFNFARNSKNKLTFTKMKHLLWGDWVKVTDYSYQTDDKRDIRTPAEQAIVTSKLDEISATMVPVRVRGVSGYMHLEDLHPEQLLEIIFLDVGQGDGALMITPDNKKYVIDAGKEDHMYRYLEWRFAGFKNSFMDFDGFVITHPDADHYNGFSDIIANPEVQVRNIWHNGLVEQFKVTPGGTQDRKKAHLLGPRETVSGQGYLTGLIETDDALKDHLSEKKRWINEKTNRPKLFPNLLNNAVEAHTDTGRRRCPNIEMLSTQHGEIVDGKSYLPEFGPNTPTGCVIEVIGPFVEPSSDGSPRLRVFNDKPMKKTTSMNAGKTKNGHSILLRLEYGNLRILFGGDLNSSAEMFLLEKYTGIDVFDDELENLNEVIEEAKPVFEVDVAKSCHHGSADFTDSFLQTVGASATVVSSGDEESHAHPRCDTIGALGLHGYGHRPLVFSTELARSAKEFTNMEDTPWFKAAKLEGQLAAETDPAKREALQTEIDKYNKWTKIRNVTSYGAINLRSDGERVVMAYMLEKSSRSRRWDVYTLEAPTNGRLRYKDVKKAAEDEKKRRAAAGTV